MSPALDLRLPAPEWRRAAQLAEPWADFLYAPGPGLVTEVDAGSYRATLFVALASGGLIRVTSLAVPAFGGSLCRIRLEAVAALRMHALGSFFDPARRGLVFAFTPDRRSGAVWPPADPSWRYDGPPLRPRLGGGGPVRVLRESGRTPDGGEWTADRGLVLGGDGDAEIVLLAAPDESERAVLLRAEGVHRALVDPAEPERPGASMLELLGYGDWDEPPALEVRLLDAAGPP